MLNIPALRSARFAVQLKEISMLNAIKLAKMPLHASEKQNTFLLQSIIESVEGIECDPKYWTVQERLFAIGHYIAVTQDDDPDFAIGEARYSDYLMGDRQYKLDHYDLGVYGDDAWSAIPLLGIMAETIEALEGEIIDIDQRTHWNLGAMACQLVVNGDALDYRSPDYDQQVLERMLTLSQFSESDFIYLLTQLNVANAQMMHLFDLTMSDVGIVAKPIGGADKPYARFPADSAISTLSKQLCGKPDRSST